MSQKPVWGTGELPHLPKDLRWDIRVVPGGTYVRVQEVAAGFPTVMESYIDVREFHAREVYLTKVWNAAHGLAQQINDARQRAEWLNEVFHV